MGSPTGKQLGIEWAQLMEPLSERNSESPRALDSVEVMVNMMDWVMARTKAVS